MDALEEYSKEEILDYFFINVSPTGSDMYPCYYKYAAGEHQFVVRNCFDQLKHLVENYNLEIKIPRVASNGSDSNSTQPQIDMETTIHYYLRMNISPFKTGQVEPTEYIDMALTRRFNALDRMLNLENFQNIEGKCCRFGINLY